MTSKPTRTKRLLGALANLGVLPLLLITPLGFIIKDYSRVLFMGLSFLVCAQFILLAIISNRTTKGMLDDSKYLLSGCFYPSDVSELPYGAFLAGGLVLAKAAVFVAFLLKSMFNVTFVGLGSLSIFFALAITYTIVDNTLAFFGNSLTFTKIEVNNLSLFTKRMTARARLKKLGVQLSYQLNLLDEAELRESYRALFLLRRRVFESRLGAFCIKSDYNSLLDSLSADIIDDKELASFINKLAKEA